MLKYYKGNGQAQWKLSDEHSPVNNAVFETVLALDRNPNDIETSLEQSYWGPFYIDIDDDKDFANAHSITKQILRYLVKSYNLNVDTDIQVFATGKKGFHILLNPYLFMDHKPKKQLAYRYKLMAAMIQTNLEVKLDMVVYSGKKGRMWRIPNVVREDNGKFKVQLTFLEAISEDSKYIIDTLCLEPRTGLNTGWTKIPRNPLAVSWFKACEIPVIQNKMIIEEEDLRNQEIPEGISKLAALKDININARFNLLILNAAVYGARAGWTEADTLKYFTKTLTYDSSVYTTKDSKIDHFRNVFGFVRENKDYKFDCHFLSTVVDKIDCKKIAASTDGADDYDEDFGIYSKDFNYYLGSDTGPRRLTGFTMTILHDVADKDKISYEIRLKNARKRVKTIIVPENSFATKSGFAKFLSPDYPLFCSEKEFAMIAWHIRKDEPNIQIGRDFIGLHYQDKKWHYANAEGSISLDNDIDRIKVNAKSLTIVNTKLDYNWPDVTKKQLKDSIVPLTSFNQPQIVVPMISWFFGSFFKPHYNEAFSQFPLLFIFGEAGAGKTATGLKLRRLFAMEDKALKSITDVTQFSLMAACNSSNLIPLILDEYKPMMMKEAQTHLVSRLIRGAYNASRGERGTASQEIIAYYYRAPIVLLGEQSIIETAVQHRVIEVQLSRQFIQSGKYTKNFNKIDDLALESIGKGFLTLAMSISPAEVKERTNKHLSYLQTQIKLPERPMFNLAVVRVSLDFITEYYAQHGINIKTTIDDLFDDYFEHLKKGNGVIDSIANKNDIIKIIETFSQMADFNASPVPITNNVHYVHKDGQIHLNIQAIYPLFSKYNRDYSLGIFDPGYISFLKMLQKEPFCTDVKNTTLISRSKNLTVSLGVKALQDRDIQISRFIGE